MCERVWQASLARTMTDLPTTLDAALTAALALSAAVALIVAQAPIAGLLASLVLARRGAFEVGDHIACDGFSGAVLSTGWTHTRLQVSHETTVDVPNATLAWNPLVNHTRRGLKRGRLDIRLDEGAATEDVRNAAVTALVRASLASVEPAPSLELCTTSPDHTTFHFYIWARDESLLHALASVREGLHRELGQRGIAVPFQNLTIHRSET